MRGRIRQFILLVVVGAAVVLLLSTYRKSIVGDSPVSSVEVTSASRQREAAVVPEVDGDSKRLKRPSTAGLLNINALMPGLTQPEEHLERMRQHELQMLNNVRDMIRHKERQQSNDDAAGDGGGSDHQRSPSLWKGMMNDEQSNNDVRDHRHQVAVIDNSEAVADQIVQSGRSPTGAANVVLSKRLVHLDLKGARPTMNYLRRLFPFLHTLGATGVLVEYEDTFPYGGRLDDFRASDSFTTQDIAELNRLAADNELDLIPLVQTFGHMEFVLKRDTFKSLREVPSLPQAICPSQNATLLLVREMIDQLVALHPNARHLHIGCDEVYNVGECPLCQERMDRHRWTTEDLLISHVRAVARYVHDKHRLRAIVWDDMFRKVSTEAIRESEIGRYADILVWKYQDDVDETLPAELWRKYADAFEGIWIASAFKGASRPNSYATEVGGRLSNHVRWMEVVQKYAKIVPFAGIVLTGWQRFDHFAALCELLPAGIPSLAVNLRYLQSLEWSVADEERVREELGCNLPVPLHLNANGPEMQIHCSFPGSRVFELTLVFHTLIANMDAEFFKSNYVLGWLSEYNVRARFSSPALLEQAELRYADAQRNLTFFKLAMESALSELFDRSTVLEWLDTYVTPIAARLERYNYKIKWLLVPNVWPKRPVYPDRARSTSSEVPKVVLAEPTLMGQQKLHAMEP